MGKLDYNKKVWFIFAPSPNLKVPRYSTYLEKVILSSP